VAETSSLPAEAEMHDRRLKGMLTPDEIESCGIDSQLRPEALTPAQFGLLAAQRSRLYSKDQHIDG